MRRLHRFRPPRSQRGAAAVEAALGIVLLSSVSLLAADMVRVSLERSRLENAAGSAALNIAVQTQLTSAGLDALASVAMQGYEDQQELVILNVLQSGRIQWGLMRGGAGGLCPSLANGGMYSGELPQDVVEDNANGTDASTLSMIVVQACRDTREISLANLTLPSPMHVTATYRATAKVVKLDEDLQSESDAAGLASTDIDKTASAGASAS